MKTENAHYLQTETDICSFQIINQLTSDITVDITDGGVTKEVKLAPKDGTAVYDVDGSAEADICIPGVPELKLSVTESSINLLNPSSGWKTAVSPEFAFCFYYNDSYRVGFMEKPVKRMDIAIGIAMVGTVSTVRGL